MAHDQIRQLAYDSKSGEARHVTPNFLDARFFVEALPLETITNKQFQVMQFAAEAVKTIQLARLEMAKELKKSWYIWLKNPSNFKSDQASRLRSLSKTNLKTVRAYQLRMRLRELWDQAVDTAESYLMRWYNWAIRSRLTPMVEFARTVRRYWMGILRSVINRMTNAILEGINSKIQPARSRARGNPSAKNFSAMIYPVVNRRHYDVSTINSYLAHNAIYVSTINTM